MDFSKPAMLMPDDVVTPREPLWAPFTHCVQQLTNDWDVMQNAVSTGFGADDAEFARFKVVEYTLANFADLWNKKKDVDPAEVSNFLQLTMDDFFHVDIANSAYPLAKVLVRIFSECLQGVTTGIDAVLARIKPQSQAQAQAPQARAAQQSTEAVARQLEQVSLDGGKGKEEAKGVSEGGDGAKEGGKGTGIGQQVKANVDEDGWETVTSKRRGRRQR